MTKNSIHGFITMFTYLDIVTTINWKRLLRFETLDNHFLHAGDRIDILNKELKNVLFSNVEVSSTISRYWNFKLLV